MQSYRDYCNFKVHAMSHLLPFPPLSFYRLIANIKVLTWHNGPNLYAGSEKKETSDDEPSKL